MSTSAKPHLTPSAGLVLVHNHRFEENLERLDSLYAGRFPQLLHLMPFYCGKQSNVFRVYESSHFFQGFFAHAAEALARMDCSHYVFCGDDVLLNARFDESNLIGELQLDERAAFIKRINPFADIPLKWPHAAGALVAFEQNGGVEWKRELPTFDAAAAAFHKHGFGVEGLSWRNVREGMQFRQFAQLLFYFGKRVQSGGRTLADLKKLPYPIANSYSDFFVLPRYALRRFCELCGMFAALNLFAEVAVPTALLLSCDCVVQETETKLRGVELWSKGEIAQFEAAHNSSLTSLFQKFPHERLYIHPVKLSRWTA